MHGTACCIFGTTLATAELSWHHCLSQVWGCALGGANTGMQALWPAGQVGTFCRSAASISLLSKKDDSMHQ